MRRSFAFLAFGLATAAAGAFAEDMSGGPAYKALMGSMDRMMGGMHAKPTGNPDKDFVDMMLPHHQDAVDMARVELQYGKDPEIRQLANNIIASQDKEIVMMRAWRAKH